MKDLHLFYTLDSEEDNTGRAALAFDSFQQLARIERELHPEGGRPTQLYFDLLPEDEAERLKDLKEEWEEFYWRYEVSFIEHAHQLFGDADGLRYEGSQMGFLWQGHYVHSEVPDDVFPGSAHFVGTDEVVPESETALNAFGKNHLYEGFNLEEGNNPRFGGFVVLDPEEREAALETLVRNSFEEVPVLAEKQKSIATRMFKGSPAEEEVEVLMDNSIGGDISESQIPGAVEYVVGLTTKIYGPEDV